VDVLVVNEIEPSELTVLSNGTADPFAGTVVSVEISVCIN
jgi:hypothetical protein